MIHRSTVCGFLLGFALAPVGNVGNVGNVANGAPVGPVATAATVASAQQPPPAGDPKQKPKDAQPVQPGVAPPKAPPVPGAPAPPAPVPPDYVIGSQDILSIVFWREKEMSGDVTVRPDGKISLPLVNEVQAAGLTPEQLRAKILEAAAKYITDPDATVVVREIHSRNIFITGNVSKPGTYTLVGDMNVLQFIALAGGLAEYADSKHIVIIRTENGRPQYLNFNYNEVIKQKHVEQNIKLKAGDTIVVR